MLNELNVLNAQNDWADEIGGAWEPVSTRKLWRNPKRFQTALGYIMGHVNQLAKS